MHPCPHYTHFIRFCLRWRKWEFKIFRGNISVEPPWTKCSDFILGGERRREGLFSVLQTSFFSTILDVCVHIFSLISTEVTIKTYLYRCSWSYFPLLFQGRWIATLEYIQTSVQHSLFLGIPPPMCWASLHMIRLSGRTGLLEGVQPRWEASAAGQTGDWLWSCCLTPKGLSPPALGVNASLLFQKN